MVLPKEKYGLMKIRRKEQWAPTLLDNLSSFFSHNFIIMNYFIVKLINFLINRIKNIFNDAIISLDNLEDFCLIIFDIKATAYVNIIRIYRRYKVSLYFSVKQHIIWAWEDSISVKDLLRFISYLLKKCIKNCHGCE